jgi:hypothetical protein
MSSHKTNYEEGIGAVLIILFISVMFILSIF